MDTITVSDQGCDHQRSRIVSQSKNSDGSKRYRRECCDCAYRWTEGRIGRSSKLTDEQVLEILAAPTGCNMAELGRRFGVHRDTIRQVRCGKIRPDLRPDVDRMHAGRTCASCRFHGQESGCMMQFPEYVEIGQRFAAECVTYVKICDDGHAPAFDESHT